MQIYLPADLLTYLLTQLHAQHTWIHPYIHICIHAYIHNKHTHITYINPYITHMKAYKHHCMQTEELLYCQICREYTLSGNTFRLRSCGHRFCRDCITQYLELKVKEGQVYPTCFYRLVAQGEGGGGRGEDEEERRTRRRRTRSTRTSGCDHNEFLLYLERLYSLFQCPWDKEDKDSGYRCRKC